MKKNLLLLFAPLLILLSCSKKDSQTTDSARQAVKDETAIKAYLAANTSIHATRDPSGLYYQILKQGTGNNSTATSLLTGNYTGKLLNDTTFAGGSFNKVLLSDLSLKGLIIGVPLIKAGGSILLIVPSALGYGTNPLNPNVPANSVLVFTIDLTALE